VSSKTSQPTIEARAGVVRNVLQFPHPSLAGHTWQHCEITGVRPGPRLCVSAGVHVNEVSAIEAAIRLQKEFDPQYLRGSVSIIPVLNQPARFHYNEYVCPVDGKNINFTFPGRSDGTFSEVLCHVVTNEWTAGAACYVDLHGGDLRENVAKFSMYQRTGDAQFDAHARRLAMCFDAQMVVGLPPSLMENPGRPPTGFARTGRFAIMSEAGSNGIVDEVAVRFHVDGVLNIARALGMLDGGAAQFARERVACSDYIWVETPVDGEFYPEIEPGDRVEAGQCVGTMRDLFGERVAEIISPADGLVLWRMTHPTLRKGMSVFAVAVEG
jgi:uncharacterized protein